MLNVPFTAANSPSDTWTHAGDYTECAKKAAVV